MNKKCTIAFLMHGDRNIGGGEQSWVFMVTKLNRDIFSPVVFYSIRNRLIIQMENLQIPTVKIELSKQITSIYRDRISYNPISLVKYLCFLIIGIWRLVKLLKKHEIKILHVHDNLSKIIGGIASKLARIKVITNCNDQLGRSFIDRVLLFWQRYFMDAVFCVTNFVGKLFANKGVIPKHIHIVSSAIEPKHWERTKRKRTDSIYKVNDGDIVLGIIAVFDECKGHVYLFKAIENLVSHGVTNLCCMVAGEGREKERLQEYVVKNNMENYIRFLGFVDNAKILLEEIDILIIPSLQESFGLVALEAMAMEVPVVASKVGGLPEIVEDGNTGILVSPANPESLGRAIKYLMNKPDVRCDMGKRGRNRVAQLFDIDKTLRITEKIIWKLVGENA